MDSDLSDVYSPTSPGYSPATSDNSAAEPRRPGSRREPFLVGLTLEARKLYREDRRQPWQEWTSADVGKYAQATASSKKFALIVRREERFGETGEPFLALHSITVQSPIIRELLGPVFAGYPGIQTKLKKMEFRAPFHMFFHRWNQFLQARPPKPDGLDTDGEAETRHGHYQLLHDTISPEIVPQVKEVKDLLRNNVMSAKYLWALFEPGTSVYSKVEDHERVYVVRSGRYEHDMGGKLSTYSLECEYIDTDGFDFELALESREIETFEGVRPLSALSVLPCSLKPDIEEIKQRLEERGRKFASLNGFNFKAYTGMYSLHHAPPGASDEQYVENARVIIDRASFTQYGEDPTGSRRPPPRGRKLCALPADLGLEYHPPSAPRTKEHPKQGLSTRGPSSRGGINEPTGLEGYHVLCSPTVRGFCLRSKEWVYLSVDRVHDIEWNNRAFEQLVLPHDYKQLIFAFVESQTNHSTDFDDIIRGKGKGIVMLLSGTPGTGKTLTSEAVADAMRKPLYSMSAGELGDTATSAEKSMQRVLELSTKWGAVLLLDECDVFLEARTAADLQRNRLVSVFLRLLEYYEGVMFLTTNRPAALDTAFESRIHLTLHYPPLEADSRLAIWRTFTRPSPDHGGDGGGISDGELGRLALLEFNGRQIKNIVKTARLLAAKDRAPLSIEHIRTVLRVKGYEYGPTLEEEREHLASIYRVFLGGGGEGLG